MFSKRLFAGIAIPDTVTRPIIESVSKMKKTANDKGIDVKWSPIDNWHVTVWFFGDTDQEKISILRDALKKAATSIEPFELELKGFGAFNEPQSARVLWAGVNRTKELVGLRENVMRELSGIMITIPPDEHEYTPHLTVGRLKSPQSVTGLIEPVVRRKLSSFAVEELVLYESVMQNYIPKYTAIERFRFQSK